MKRVDQTLNETLTTDEDGECSLLLRDGTYVPVRRIRPDDAAALQRFHGRLSEQSIYRRFFGLVPTLTDERALYFTQIDNVHRIALVALDPRCSDEIIAVVRLDGSPDMRSAEYAAIVEDCWQGRGVGFSLTQRLFEIARERGFREIVAFVLSDNDRMVALLRDIGLPSRTRCDAGTTRIELDLGPHDGLHQALWTSDCGLATR